MNRFTADSTSNVGSMRSRKPSRVLVRFIRARASVRVQVVLVLVLIREGGFRPPLLLLEEISQRSNVIIAFCSAILKIIALILRWLRLIPVSDNSYVCFLNPLQLLCFVSKDSSGFFGMGSWGVVLGWVFSFCFPH